jgi:hypothetical protein
MSLSEVNKSCEKNTPFIAKIFLDKLEEVKKSGAVLASLKKVEDLPIALSEMGIDVDLSNKELYVTDIDKYYGIGGSCSRVYVLVEFYQGYERLDDYLIPTNYLIFKN